MHIIGRGMCLCLVHCPNLMFESSKEARPHVSSGVFRFGAVVRLLLQTFDRAIAVNVQVEGREPYETEHGDRIVFSISGYLPWPFLERHRSIGCCHQLALSINLNKGPACSPEYWASGEPATAIAEDSTCQKPRGRLVDPLNLALLNQ